MSKADRVHHLAQPCIHCGLCLESCPTWQLTGREDLSPRGRIHLMVGAAEGRIAPCAVLPAIDSCLGCRACETACPSGVAYGALLEAARTDLLEPARGWGIRRAFWRPLIRRVLPYRRRLAATLLPLRILTRLPRAVRSRLPGLAGRLVTMLPDSSPPEGIRALPPPGALVAHSAPASPAGGVPFVPEARGAARREARLLEGCALPVMHPAVVRASERLLLAAGYRVVRMRSGCCGALEAHDGLEKMALARAAACLASAEAAPGAVVVTEAAGCGAHLKAHRGQGDLEVRDLSEALVEAGWQPRSRLYGPGGGSLRAAFQDPCHLLHGQRLRDPARELLRRAGVAILSFPDAGRCCGGAGTHAFLHPGRADALGEAKWQDAVAGGPDVVVTANPSCQMQLERARIRSGSSVPVLHLAELLAYAL